MKKSNNIGTFVKGSLIGAVVGAVAGLLLAPQSGKKTREDIKDKATGALHDLQSQLHQMSDDMGARVDNLKSAAKELKGEAREESQELLRRAEVLKQDMRIAATNLAKNGAKAKDATAKDLKVLLNEGSGVMKELERLTKTLATSAKDKVAGNGKREG